jgi:hypothetical protein
VWILLACAIAGLAAFGLMARSVTSTERITHADPTRRFEAQRISSGQPLLELAPDGSVIRRKPSPTSPPTALERVNVWVYRIATQRFIETRIPFWFFRLKAPANGLDRCNPFVSSARDARPARTPRGRRQCRR